MPGHYSATERITPSHYISDFDCGSAEQTRWFLETAVQSDRSNDTKVFVTRRLSDDRVVGYYGLTMGGLLRDESPDRLLKGAGSYRHIPVLLLPRLAVDLSEQRKGLGKRLLLDAFHRAIDLSEIVGFRALVLHAETETAKEFYLHHADFMVGPIDGLQLSALLKDIRAALRR